MAPSWPIHIVFERLFQGTSRIDLVVDPALANPAVPAWLLGAVALATSASARLGHDPFGIGDVDAPLHHQRHGRSRCRHRLLRRAGLTALGQKQLTRLRLTTRRFVLQHILLPKNLCLLGDVVLPADLAWLAPGDALTERALALMERTGVAAGTDLEQRRVDVTEWVIEQDPGVGRRYAAA